jgi:hypothetical protein
MKIRMFRGGFAFFCFLAVLLGGLVLVEPEPTPIVYAQAKEDGGTPKVMWRMLRKLNYKTGEMPADLKAFNNKTVRIPGFIVPLEDSATQAAEFLLVPYQGACIHVPPPPPNQIVHVLMQKGRKMKFTMWDPYWIEGKLLIDNVESPYGLVAFRLEGLSYEDYEY